MRNLIYFIAHFHTFLKFYFTNWRAKRYGYRIFKFRLYEEKSKAQGGGYGELDILTIQAESIDNAFIILRDKHKDIFQKGDHLTYKEVI